MMSAGRWLFLVVTAVAASALAGAQAPPAIAAGGQRELTRYLAAAVERGDVPGVVALIVDREGVVYEGTAGKLDVARGEPMRSDAIFRIASMTKPITSVAVMMLHEAGALDLDDAVSKHLPGFAGREVISSFDADGGTVATRPAARPLTIRHLMAHTSGIGYAFSSPVVARLQRDSMQSETELPLLHDPGERWTYGASTRVLGEIVSKLSGQPIDRFLAARVFEPLGMRDTGYDVPAAHLPRVVTVHTRKDGRLAEVPNAATQAVPPRGDGGLYSTAGDYGRFLRLLLNAGQLGPVRLLSGASVRMMGENQIGSVVVTEQPPANPALTRPFPLGAGLDTFGLGFQIAARDPRYTNLRSPGSLSWAGLNNTHFWIDPGRQVAVVVLMQVLPFYDEGCIRTLRGIEEIVYRHLG